MEGRIALLFLFVGLVVAGPRAKHSHVNIEDPNIDHWEKAWKWMQHKLEHDDEMREQLERHIAKYDDGNAGIDIPDYECEALPGDDPPTSVHQLRPQDVNVVAAFGDSITAGFGLGATGVIGLSNEHRGESWSIGGNDETSDPDETTEDPLSRKRRNVELEVLTIPNLIKPLNPALHGWSWAKPPRSCGVNQECAQFNVAVSGATAVGIEGQAQRLVDKMQEDENVNFAEDWKLMTLFIGGNDLCRVCNNDNHLPVNHVAQIKAGIDLIRANVPRVFFQVVVMFDVTPIYNMSSQAEDFPSFCAGMHQTACGCALNPETVPVLQDAQHQYWELLDDLINVQGEYDGDDDFTVVLQPHLRDQGTPYDENGFFDMSLFAPDCFHPSRKGHQISALTLWNTMLKPVHEKPFDVTADYRNQISCATEERPYFFTNDNSRALKAKEEPKKQKVQHPKQIHKPKVQVEEPKSKDKQVITEDRNIEHWESIWREMLHKLEHDDEMREQLERHIAKYDDGNAGIDIPDYECEALPGDEPPISVHQLRPQDVNVVAAFGDSITAGFGLGASGVIGLSNEHRGEAWSIGGNDETNAPDETTEDPLGRKKRADELEVLTIPNLIKPLNPAVHGWSWAKPPISCGVNQECAQLNVAVSGATAVDIEGQAQSLVDKMQEDENVNFAEDWKLMTLFIGGNDLCRSCNNDDHLPVNHVAQIKAGIDLIRANVPRVFFQVVVMFDVTPISNMSSQAEDFPAFCSGILSGACGCALDQETIPVLQDYQHQYWELLDDLINVQGEYDGDDDFTVVLQPHLRDQGAPYNENGFFDMSLFAPDCFHPSRKGHQISALTLWNTMLKPVHEKPFDVNEDYRSQISCATEERPYIFTNDNSRALKIMEEGVMKKKVVTKIQKPKVEVEDPSEEYYDKMYNALEEIEAKGLMEKYIEIEEKYYSKQRNVDIPEFNCDIRPGGPKPTSVHELGPEDIDVIATFGDSITAGNGVGANTLPGVAIENRGEVWTCGGNGTIANTLTIANLIKEFNPELQGWSFSRSGLIRNESHCNYGWPCAQLNMAQPGGTCRNMLPQAVDMVAAAQEMESIDFEDDWKLVSLFIGGNDLCAVCRSWDRYNPEQHVADIKSAIDYLQENMPRTLVQVITMFDVTPIYDQVSEDPIRDGICRIMYNQFCSCAQDPESIPLLKDVVSEYWRLLDELINVDAVYEGQDEFAVVLQPFLRDMTPFTYIGDDGEEYWDMDFFSPDCFHPSKDMHFSMAYGLWNTMLTPVQEKAYDYEPEEDPQFLCPTEERPYIFTNENSRDVLPKITEDKTLSSSLKEYIHKENEDTADEYDDENYVTTKIERIMLGLEKRGLMGKYLERLEKYQKKDGPDFIYPDFECDIDDDTEYVPESVHALRPNDIKVVAAFGDSITAGNGLGAQTLPGVAIENRGESWMVGGNNTFETVLTVPNILKHFNPEIRGASWSPNALTERRNDTHCNYGWPCAQLNMAQPGGTCRNMLPQAIDMVETAKTIEGLDFETDFKLISLFIGGNDLCAVCRRWERYNPEQHVSDIKDALDYLAENMPRALVQVITMFDISPLVDFTSGDENQDIICNFMQNEFCDCAKNATFTELLQDVVHEYWRLLDELINVNGEYDGRDDFTVVMQPHMRDMGIPYADEEEGIWDMDPFAPDCFHPDRKAHNSMTYMLWNTMMTPVSEKTYKYEMEVVGQREFKCPSEEHPFIFTRENSNTKKTIHRSPPRDYVKRPHHDHHAPGDRHKGHTKPSDTSGKRQTGAIVAGVLISMFVGTVLVGLIVSFTKDRKQKQEKKKFDQKKTEIIQHFDNEAFKLEA